MAYWIYQGTDALVKHSLGFACADIHVTRAKKHVLPSVNNALSAH